MKLSSVITLSTSRTADPASAGIDRFVGLEHIEPENLHIRSWGLVADGTTFTSTFKRGQVIFIDAVYEVTRERSMSYLKPEHQQRVADTYHAFKDVEGFAKVASLADIRANDGNLSIPLYVRGKAVSDEKGEYAADGLREAIMNWENSNKLLAESVEKVLRGLINGDDE